MQLACCHINSYIIQNGVLELILALEVYIKVQAMEVTHPLVKAYLLDSDGITHYQMTQVLQLEQNNLFISIQ